MQTVVGGKIERAARRHSGQESAQQADVQGTDVGFQTCGAIEVIPVIAVADNRVPRPAKIFQIAFQKPLECHVASPCVSRKQAQDVGLADAMTTHDEFKECQLTLIGCVGPRWTSSLTHLFKDSGRCRAVRLDPVMMWRSGTVTALGKSWGQAQECRVTLEDQSEARALAYCQIVGTPEVGDRVLLTAATAVRKLGTGGYMMIAAIPDRLPPDPEPAPGHIVKARYTPLQYMTMGADEQESPWHDRLADADSIDGMPVVVADLHSALPAAVAAILARRPEARIAYIMDDGGALPVWFSRTCAELTEREHILGTITARQAFGGELETVNIHTALLAARLVWDADTAIISQGPGNLGTGTTWGFSGTAVGEAINAVNALDGHAIALLRMSSGDKRERHMGLSHHTVTALTRVALSPAVCPVPNLADHDELSQMVPAETRDIVAAQMIQLFSCPRLIRSDVSTAGLTRVLQRSPIRMSTMGRGLAEDPLAFLAAGVAGYAAAELI